MAHYTLSTCKIKPMMIVRIKNFIRPIANKIFGVIKSVNASEEAIDDDLIYQSQLFHVNPSCDVFGKEHIDFKGYKSIMPKFCVKIFENGYCLSNKEEIFSKDKRVIKEYTSHKTNPKIGQNKLLFFTHKRKKINGSVAHLSMSGLENNFYHFLTECISRLYLVERSKFKPDYYIISNHLNFQKEILEILGIKPERIIPANQKVLFRIKNLIVPDFINNWEVTNYRGYSMAKKQWQPYWCGQIYLDKIQDSLQIVPQKKIYISRQKSLHRKFVNNRELEDVFLDKGFEIHYLETLTVQKQIDLFSSATHIIGIHGAGFANLYFAHKSTKFLEIFSQYYHDSSYRILTSALGINYYYLIGETADIDTTPQKEDIYVNPQTLELALFQFLNS